MSQAQSSTIPQPWFQTCQPDNPDHYHCPACIQAWPHPPQLRCPAVWKPEDYGIKELCKHCSPWGPPKSAFQEYLRHGCWGALHGHIVWPIKEDQTFHQWLYMRRQESERWFSDNRSKSPWGQTTLAGISAKEPEERPRRSRSPLPLRLPPTAVRQKSIEDVYNALSKKVQGLERTKPVLKGIFEDGNIDFYLPCGWNFIPNGQNLLTILAKKKHRFKIGITPDPVKRFLTADYAYLSKHIQAKDNICYTRMTIILCSESWQVVGMLEHSLIDWVHRTHPRISANKLPGFDGPKYDDSDTDEDEVSAPGQFFCYVADGPSISPHPYDQVLGLQS